MTFEERARERRKRIVANRARTWEEAEDWDLKFWQEQGPEARLSALVAIRRDIELIQKARKELGLPDLDWDDGE